MGNANPTSLQNGVDLKALVTAENRNKAVLACTVLFGILYGIPNHFPYFEPRYLSLTSIDQATPFVTETVWIYFSAYTMAYITFYSIRDIINLNRMIFAFLTLAFSSALIFTLFPTTYPRTEFPLPAELDSWTLYLFHLLRKADAPTNCAPSLHVGISYLSALPFFSEGRKKTGTFFILWTLAVWISTATTKQHYWLDGLLGIILVSVIYFFFERKVRWQNQD
jgi:hypothetical protein